MNLASRLAVKVAYDLGVSVRELYLGLPLGFVLFAVAAVLIAVLLLGGTKT